MKARFEDPSPQARQVARNRRLTTAREAQKPGACRSAAGLAIRVDAANWLRLPGPHHRSRTRFGSRVALVALPSPTKCQAPAQLPPSAVLEAQRMHWHCHLRYRVPPEFSFLGGALQRQD